MTTLVCAGQPVNRFDNSPSGTPCGTVYEGDAEAARVAGWRVGPAGDDGARPAMCPDCARPGTTGHDDEDVRAVVLEPLPGL